MSKLNSICVFCGSKAGSDPEYQQSARDLGHLLAEREIALVYGGGSVGLMGIIADAVLEAGGKVIGVVVVGASVSYYVVRIRGRYRVV